jgi:hypothetical protein
MFLTAPCRLLLASQKAQVLPTVLLQALSLLQALQIELLQALSPVLIELPQVLALSLQPLSVLALE